MSSCAALPQKMCRRAPLLPLLCLFFFFVSPLTAQGQTDDDDENVGLHEDEGLQQMDVEDRDSGSEEKGAIPGRKGQDYPVYKVVPTTSFTCSGRLVPGYYADPDTRCQVFHICGGGGAKHSFLCPEGSVFNQQYLVCDWWYRAPCGESLFRHSSEYDIEDIQYSDSFPLDEDSDIFQTIETGSPARKELKNPNDDNDFVM